jgi:hypothetical protein
MAPKLELQAPGHYTEYNLKGVSFKVALFRESSISRSGGFSVGVLSIDNIEEELCKVMVQCLNKRGKKVARYSLDRIK